MENNQMQNQQMNAKAVPPQMNHGGHEMFDVHEVLSGAINTMNTYTMLNEHISDPELRDILERQKTFMQEEYNITLECFKTGQPPSKPTQSYKMKQNNQLENNRSNLLQEEEAFQLLNGTENGVFSNLYGQWAGTIHTSAYFPSKLEAWLALGGDQQPVKFDFAAWLNGEDFPVSEVTGIIDTDIPFVHMEKADWFKGNK